MLCLDQSVFGYVFKDVVVFESVVLGLHTYNPWRKAQWMAMFDMIVSMASKALSTFGLPSYQRLLLRLQCLNWVRRFHFVAGRARIRVRNKNEMQICVFLTVGCQYISRDFHQLASSLWDGVSLAKHCCCVFCYTFLFCCLVLLQNPNTAYPDVVMFIEVYAWLPFYCDFNVFVSMAEGSMDFGENYYAVHCQ